MFYKLLYKILFIFPVILLLSNITNILFPIDYRDDPSLIKGYFSKENKKILNYISLENRQQILKYEDAIKKFDDLYAVHGESLTFLNEATKIYFISKVPTEYSWKEKYTKIKFRENWILYFFRKFEELKIKQGTDSKYKGAYISYQSSDYKFALKRGISICSQDALSFANLIKRRYDIDYMIIGLAGHVVLQAKINNNFYLSDPNMGLTFDFSIDEYYDSPKNKLKIRKAYSSIGRPELIDYFDSEGNRKFKYTGPKPGVSTYNPDTLTFFSDYLKWVLPICLMLIAFYLKKRRS
jgi:hypothetical protein|tara:strand:- start:2008 stop:2892 length:885 start_codon:yes stop_codon:yes gene_type:complete